MDTDALRLLQQVADGTTVTEVSELESVTQSGVSRALARLEAQIGTPLLRRSGRTLRMTHAGAVFKPHLDALLHHLDNGITARSEEHTSELQSRRDLVCRLLLEKKKKEIRRHNSLKKKQQQNKN